MQFCCCFLLVFILPLIFWFAVLIKKFFWRNIKKKNAKVIAFFHPFCAAGGGGERVLWAAIKSLHGQHPEHIFLVYSGKKVIFVEVVLLTVFNTDNYEEDFKEIVNKAQNTFQIDLNFEISSVKLKTCFLLNPKLYPFCTLFFQSIAFVVPGLEALWRCPPDVFVDTMGASFAYPLFLSIGTKVVAYVHYPIISLDMLHSVASNIANFNNNRRIANSLFLTRIKLLYYRIFSWLYLITGKCTHIAMVNSTWTKNHIDQAWMLDAKLVYPPCNTEKLMKLKLDTRNTDMIVSIGQFRPEKNHQLQLKIIAHLVKLLTDNGVNRKPLLVLVGSCRNIDDQARVASLKHVVQDLRISQYVEFKVNTSYEEMEEVMQQASIALHTMTNEHFGISVVEFLAAGLLTVTHNSGGPKLDIIKENENGFLAEDVETFAQALFRLMNMNIDNQLRIRKKARESVGRFSEEAFEVAFFKSMAQFL